MDDKLPESFFISLLQERAGFLSSTDTPVWPGFQTSASRRAHDPSATQLRLLVEGLRDAAIFFLDAEGSIREWTLSAERLLGYPEAAMLGSSITQFTPVRSPETHAGELQDQMMLALERAALLGQSETPGWQRCADGSLIWANTVLTALHDTESEEAPGYACLMRDMTENKRLLDMLQELNADLDTRVQERTRELQDINRDLEAFSSSVSHDLRAPLRHISSFVELLREELGTTATPAVERQIDTIAQAADHMGQMIEGLLAFSRLGRAPLRKRPVPMMDLLQASLNRTLHDPSLRRPADALQWHLPERLPTVRGDSLLLSEVWDNLLTNALKYSRQSQPAIIRIGASQTPEGEEPTHWIFWIEDNGVGFNPQRAERLFGMFQRLHRASEFEGTGIGLALCRRIIERHGGRIWAESTPKIGSTFYFNLPAA